MCWHAMPTVLTTRRVWLADELRCEMLSLGAQAYPNEVGGILAGYRNGGGRGGNVGTQTLTELLTTIPYVAGATNLTAASGGGRRPSARAGADASATRMAMAIRPGMELIGYTRTMCVTSGGQLIRSGMPTVPTPRET